LGYYGINSNTSAAGFLKCTHRKIKDKEKVKESVVASISQTSAAKDLSNG